MDNHKLVWILKVVSNGKKYKVYIDEDTFYTFSEDQLIQYHIVKGNSFYDSEWEEIINSLDVGILFDKTLKYIDFKMRTVKEVKDYLIKKKVTSDTIDEIINKLFNLHYLDDERYTKSYVYEKFNELNGPIAIRYYLRIKGVNDDVISKELENYSDDDWLSKAKVLAGKAIKSLKGLPLQRQKEALYTRLNRMGYQSSTINLVMSYIEFNPFDKNVLLKEYESLKQKGFDDYKIYNKLLTKGYSYQEINDNLKLKYKDNLQGEV